MRSVTEVMNGLLARLYQPLDTTDNPSLTNDVFCSTVEHSAAFQDQDQATAYAEYESLGQSTDWT